MKAGIIEGYMLEYIDGFYYEYSNHKVKTTTHYTNFALIISPGSAGSSHKLSWNSNVEINFK